MPACTAACCCYPDACYMQYTTVLAVRQLQLQAADMSPTNPLPSLRSVCRLCQAVPCVALLRSCLVYLSCGAALGSYSNGPVSSVGLARCQPDGRPGHLLISLCSSLLQVSRFLQHAEFLPGEPLMRQGERGDHMFIILAGTCKASSGAGADRFCVCCRGGPTLRAGPAPAERGVQ